MNRFHVHLHVADLAANVAFYSRLFGTEPTRRESDYAKWMLDDPRLNFAISSRGNAPGIGHLGFQADDTAGLDTLKRRAQAADMPVLDEGATSCCYARSDKHWVSDPQGIAWEHFHTLQDLAVFNEKSDAAPAGVAAREKACCPATATAAADKGPASCC